MPRAPIRLRAVNQMGVKAMSNMRLSTRCHRQATLDGRRQQTLRLPLSSGSPKLADCWLSSVIMPRRFASRVPSEKFNKTSLCTLADPEQRVSCGWFPVVARKLRGKSWTKRRLAACRSILNYHVRVWTKRAGAGSLRPMKPHRLLLLVSLAALLGGCAACLPDAMKRDANASTAASGVIGIPGNPTPQPE